MANCIHMLTVQKKDKSYVQVPCGSCLPCRKKKAAALKRLSEFVQQDMYKKVFHVLLIALPTLLVLFRLLMMVYLLFASLTFRSSGSAFV